MILYALACLEGHRFDSWFRSGADFDDQSARGLVACPHCQSTAVSKTIMAPAVVSRGSAGAPAEAPEPAGPPPAPLLDERQVAVRGFLKAMREKVLSEAEDVGAKFPEEARRMHEGAIPHRHIHGQATADEVRGLLEDGVSVLPVPIVPDELN